MPLLSSLQAFEHGMPNQSPKSPPTLQPLPSVRTTTPLFTLKRRRIVEFGRLIVGSQGLSGGLSINCAQAFAGLVRRFVGVLAKLRKSFAQTLAKVGKLPGPEQKKNQSKNQHHLPSPHSQDAKEDCHATQYNPIRLRRLVDF